jgi:hypothetical protein
VPKAITVNNGTQFDAEMFKVFCDQIGTKIHFAWNHNLMLKCSRHLESNGLVQRANGIIMTGIMKLIFSQPRGKWPDELIKVVWNHNTACWDHASSPKVLQEETASVEAVCT